MLLPKKANKLLLQWKGPYKVIEKFGGYAFRLQVGNKMKTIHANLLKLYVERSDIDKDVHGHVSIAVLDQGSNDDETYNDDPDELLTNPSINTSETPHDVQISNDLTPEQRVDLTNEFSYVFTDRPGQTNLIEHDIRTTTETPFRLKPYPLPFAMTVHVNEEIDKMLQMQVIEPSESA